MTSENKKDQKGTYPIRTDDTLRCGTLAGYRFKPLTQCSSEEETGFEPAKQFIQLLTCFPSKHLNPLGHSSANWRLGRDSNPRDPLLEGLPNFEFGGFSHLTHLT